MSTNDSDTNIFNLSAQALDYNLPDERIAKYPLPERDQSKLLVWQNGEITDSRFLALTDFLPQGSLLVFNNTKVIRARLLFQKATGAHIEIFCLDPLEPSDYQLAFQQTQSCSWNCMVGNLKKWKDEVLEMTLNVNGKQVIFKAEKRNRIDGAVQVHFSWDCPEVDFSSLIEAAGILPIPPYLHRETEESDLERYQTVYSKIKGSVAAPTAGLHFTDEVFNKLQEHHIDTAEVTLHVGAGTFRPVKAATIGEHEMHAEQIIVERALIEQLLAHSGKLIAVGTTSIRTLESLYWLGVKIHQNPEIEQHELDIEQWLPYQEQVSIGKTESLQAILAYMERHQLKSIGAHTQIIIVPGYEFRIVEGMFTNFHQPQSTLLLLISAFIGNDWERVYQHALDTGYRFLSYGDSNLYLKS